jgi:hypothetical protein
MHTLKFTNAMRLGLVDAVREIGMALHHLDELQENTTNHPAQRENLADIQGSITTANLILCNLADQTAKAETAIK